jgi:hypothetical protein
MMKDKDWKPKEKKQTLAETVREVIRLISAMISENVISPITNGVDDVMDKIEIRLHKLQKKFAYQMFALILVALGIILLVISLTALLRDSLGWSNFASYFTVGIAVLFTGLLVKWGVFDSKYT